MRLTIEKCDTMRAKGKSYIVHFHTPLIRRKRYKVFVEDLIYERMIPIPREWWSDHGILTLFSCDDVNEIVTLLRNAE